MDALEEEAEEGIDQHQSHPVSLSSHDSAESSVPPVVPAEARIPSPRAVDTPPHDSAESCRRLAYDAPHGVVTQAAEGNLLHLGRKARKISTPLWRALMTRDRTCQFPDCARRRHLQAHHWAVHEGGLKVEGRAPYRLLFRRPDGSVLPSCPVRLPIKGEAGESLKEANRKYGLHLTAHTFDSFWDGEAMDDHMAVDGLLSFEEEDPKDEE